MNKEELALKIDHTVLKATATQKDIEVLCAEAKKYTFSSVCVNPVWVPFAAKELAGCPVKVCTVVGFPLGASSPSVKAKEAAHAVLQGASEIDMVIDIGALKGGNVTAVEADIRGVVEAVKEAAKQVSKAALVKVIIETCYLTDDEKIAACLAAKKAGADFVKTSTGFGNPAKDAEGKNLPTGATEHDVSLMRKTVDNAEPKNRIVQVKASGGIRDLKTALTMIKAGADRLGVSAGVDIVEALEE